LGLSNSKSSSKLGETNLNIKSIEIQENDFNDFDNFDNFESKPNN